MIEQLEIIAPIPIKTEADSQSATRRSDITSARASSACMFCSCCQAPRIEAPTSTEQVQTSPPQETQGRLPAAEALQYPRSQWSWPSSTRGPRASVQLAGTLLASTSRSTLHAHSLTHRWHSRADFKKRHQASEHLQFCDYRRPKLHLFPTFGQYEP